MRITKFMIIALMLFSTVASIGAIGYSLSDSSAQIGTQVTISWTGLTASNTYSLKDESGIIVDYFETAASETTHNSYVTLSHGGENTYTLYNATSGASLDTVTIYGQDPFDSLLYSITPLILAAAVVSVFMLFVRRLGK